MQGVSGVIRSHSKLAGGEIKKALKLYRSGFTLSDLADIYGYSTPKIQQLMKRWGGKAYEKVAAKRKGHRLMKKEQIVDVLLQCRRRIKHLNGGVPDPVITSIDQALKSLRWQQVKSNPKLGKAVGVVGNTQNTMGSSEKAQ